MSRRFLLLAILVAASIASRVSRFDFEGRRSIFLLAMHVVHQAAGTLRRPRRNRLFRRAGVVPDFLDRGRRARRLWPALIGPGWRPTAGHFAFQGTDAPCSLVQRRARCLLQDRDHAIDNVVDCSLRRKRRFLIGVLLPITLGMHAIANDLMDVILFFDAPRPCVAGEGGSAFYPSVFQ